VESAGAISAEFAVPAVAIPRDPGVNLARNENEILGPTGASNEFSSREEPARYAPSVHAGQTFRSVDRLHERMLLLGSLEENALTRLPRAGPEVRGARRDRSFARAPRSRDTGRSCHRKVR